MLVRALGNFAIPYPAYNRIINSQEFDSGKLRYCILLKLYDDVTLPCWSPAKSFFKAWGISRKSRSQKHQLLEQDLIEVHKIEF